MHRRLAEFEKRVSRHVVVRHATGYRLTEFGSELRPFAEQVEKAITALKRHLVAADDSPTGSVRLTCSESIGYRLVQSDLGLRIELVMSDHFLDIAKGEADVAIRAGASSEETLVGRKIADVPWALYGSRAYLQGYGRPARVEDIDVHAVIGFDGDIKDHHAAKWLRSVAPSARTVARSNTVPGLLMSVRSGAGLAPLPMPLAARDAELERVIGPVPGLYSPIYLLTHPDLRRMPRVSALFDFVVEELERVKLLLTERG